MDDAVTADDLVCARDLVLARAQGQRRLPAEALRQSLCDVHEFWLNSYAAEIGIASDGGICLAAVGALARKEMVPGSDLDLVLVHGGRDDISTIADRLWYPLWDAGIGVDHSVRTVDEISSVMRTDLRAALGLLDVRLIAGDASVFQRAVDTIRQQWRVGINRRLTELSEITHQRWASSGEVAHRVEPDLKHGHGGLRDVQLVQALAIAHVADRPPSDVMDAYGLLLDIRTELRRASGRSRDVLYAQYGDEVAHALGIGDRFDLAKTLSSIGRTIAYVTQVSLRSAQNAAPRRKFLPFGRTVSRKPLDDGVVLHGNEVALSRDSLSRRDPALLLRVAAAAARSNRPIAAGTLARLSEDAPELRKPWPREARDELFSLLGSGSGLVEVVESLDRTGLWGRVFPEWGAVRDLPPRDLAHTWTVDRHLVQAAAYAARLTTQVSRPDLLLLAALIHDIGKGRSADHSEVGAALAVQIGERIGLWPADVSLLASAVRHHLLLPHTATRRDVADPATVSRVVDTLEGNVVLLELLHALAEADAMATGPGVWSEWKSGLIAELVERCRAAMAGQLVLYPDPLDPDHRALAESVADSGKPAVVIAHDDYLMTITVVAQDQTGLLSRIAGLLAVQSLQVHAATANGHAGVAVDVFTVSPRFGSFPDPDFIREQIIMAVNGLIPLTEKLEAKERDYPVPQFDPPPPTTHWFDDEATGAVVFELRAADRVGLLHRVASALEKCGIDIRWAKVSTLGNTVVDSFCLVADNDLPMDTGRRQLVETAVLSSVSRD